MAVFRNPRTDKRVLLRSLHMFGRHPSCHTVLPHAEISAMHAVVRWNVARWEILDRSRNGTIVDGQRLGVNEWLTLCGARAVWMGECDDTQWFVEDLSPPADCVFPLGGPEPAIVFEAEGTFLPHRTRPSLLVYRQADDWIAESPKGATTLLDGARIMLGDREWQVVLNPSLAQTSESRCRKASLPLVLHFSLSQNEEHAILQVESEAGAIELGERVHHYALATLARLRLGDARRGVCATEQGWVYNEELTRMLGVDPSYVNIQVFRAKQQLALALPRDAAALTLIERRRGKLRLGDVAFTVRRGKVLEGGLWRATSGELVPM